MLSRRHLIIAATALGVVACTTYPARNVGPPVYRLAQVNAATKAPFGSYLVDGAGRAVYILDGQRNHAGMDRCMGECLRVWPPLHTSGPPTAGPGVDPARLSSMTMHGAPHAKHRCVPRIHVDAPAILPARRSVTAGAIGTCCRRPASPSGRAAPIRLNSCVQAPSSRSLDQLEARG